MYLGDDLMMKAACCHPWLNFLHVYEFPAVDDAGKLSQLDVAFKKFPTRDGF